MHVSRRPDGLELLRGASTYMYEENWKLAAEVHSNRIADKVVVTDAGQGIGRGAATAESAS